jgi:TrmH family RNA methyltransferase
MTERPVLTSTANPRVKVAAALRERRERTRTGLTLVDGARELRRALDAGVEVTEAFVHDPDLAGEDARAALDKLLSANVPVHRVTGPVIERLAFGDRSEGVVAVVRLSPLGLAAVPLPDDALVVVLEGVEKPGNVGAVLRSADGAGATAVIAASPRTDLANPNVIRASAGTVFAMPVAAAPSDEVLAWLRANDVRVVATRVEASRLYSDADLRGRVALVLGAEDEGLTDTWTGPDIEAIHLPMHGIADSLNVSVSAAIVLYEARRQRDRHPRPGD